MLTNNQFSRQKFILFASLMNCTNYNWTLLLIEALRVWVVTVITQTVTPKKGLIFCLLVTQTKNMANEIDVQLGDMHVHKRGEHQSSFFFTRAFAPLDSNFSNVDVIMAIIGAKNSITRVI